MTLKGSVQHRPRSYEASCTSSKANHRLLTSNNLWQNDHSVALCCLGFNTNVILIKSSSTV